ncbi:hypothetical protein OK348_06210 [Flavobacterium sp. MXW15]|uniref:Uncharacterized protein n=1 Tax=Xanthomonas chitinilytica TaxID=2989819 RepID=A0ABT3JXY2_9XANT|nr:hypothetical protein [Xanthomonas sp. H13-6]MCW4454385.1 hypothetical protein [Flavobacterium sp. MXW15]MCW4473347.1 hypothetical protein [Xanthomonas sp. H13-6]
MSMTHKSPIDENEWQAQERGMRAARDHAPAGTDAATADYRIVAEALMSAPRSAPPADFATGVAGHIARHDAGIERLLSRILLAAFLLVSIVAGVLYGDHAWQSLQQALGGEVVEWMLAGAGCVVLSWICSLLLRRADYADTPRRAPYW